MVYLKTAKLPETDGKCVLIGQAAVPLSPFTYIDDSVVEKYPHDLTSNTSDPNWELSGLYQDDLYKAFDSNTDTYFMFQMSSESGTQVSGTAIQWVRTDGKVFSVSSVTIATYNNGVIPPVWLYGTTADGDEIELAPKTTSGTHTINVDSDELVSGINVIMDGGYGPINISEITVS